MKTHKLYLAAAFALGLALPAAHAQETIKIGNIVVTAGPLKGPGEPAVTAVDIAVEEINAAGGINGKPIELIRFDTGSDPRQASVGTRKLAQDDGVLAIVGPFSSGEAVVAFNDAERLGVPMFPTSASRPGLTEGVEYGWRLSEDEEKQFRRLLIAMERNDILPKTAAIVYVSDEAVSNSAGTQLYPALLEEFGVTYGEPIPVQYKSFDLSAQVAKIVEQNPDAVALAALPESASKLVRELRRQGYEGRVIGSQIFADPNIVELFGEAGEGTMLVAGFWKGRTPEAQAFNDKLVEELDSRGIHKLGAHHSDAQAYDTVYLVKQAMEEAGVTGDPAKLQEERDAIIAAMEDISFDGVLGDDICFNGHDAELPGYVIEIKDGEWTKFDEVAADTCE